MKKLTIITIIFLFIGANAFSQSKKDSTILIKTSAVCSMCKDRLEQGLAFEKGIKTSELNIETKVLAVKYITTRTSPDNIRRAVSKLGYDADSVTADPKAYGKLPPCCKKDAAKHQ